MAMPNLKIGGLGLSTLANNGGKTAEELGDMQVLMDAKKKPLTPSSSSSSARNMNEYLDDSDSDLGLPPPPPPKNMGFKLPMAGLGLSTLKAPGQDKTAEELGDMAALLEAKNQKK